MEESRIIRDSPLLEICIPTLGRANILHGNLLSLLECSDDRYRITVSSNQPDTYLEQFLQTKEKVRYHFFEENQGFTNNVKWLLLNTEAKYILLLSDEDFICHDQLRELLDYLEDHGDRSEMYYVPSDDKYSLGNLFQLRNIGLSFRNIILTAPMGPTYMSGYIFPSSKITDKMITRSFEDHPSNAYPFIILRNLLLKSGLAFKVLSTYEICRGPEVEYGGAMYGYTPSIEIGKNIFLENSRWEHFTDHTFPTSVVETTGRFAFFNSHLRELIEGNIFLYVYSLGLIANRMRSGTGAKVELTTSLVKVQGKMRILLNLSYVAKSKRFWHLRGLLFRMFQFLIQKSSGVFRILLRRGFFLG